MKLASTMRRGASRLTYANVVASLALFIALSGVSYAATQLPKNSVTSKAIKKNAVTNPKIKRSAVDSSKIKNKSITASDIKDGTITASKINATGLTATTAADTINVVKIVASSNTGADEASARAAATEIPIASNGAVSAYAKCFFDTTSNETHFEVIARTSADGAMLNGYSISDSSTRLTTSTPEDSRQITDDETDGADSYDDDYGDDASLIGPDGKGLQLTAFNYARNGNPTDPPAFLTGTQSCAFQVSGLKIG